MAQAKENIKTYVRWMGAYGHGYSLKDSMEFELNRPATDEVACEGILNGITTMSHVRVGLLVHPKNIVKVFNGDCYSVREYNGSLKKTRNPRHSGHHYAESFAKIGRHGQNAYIGIVIKGFGSKSCGIYNLKPHIVKTIKDVSKKYHLPIYTLIGDNLKKLD